MRLALLVATLVACSSPSPPSSTLVGSNQTAALLSVWGTNASDVWAVGGSPDLASAPTALHFDGSKWDQVDTGQTGIDLWWVFGVGGDVFFSGSSGTILRYRAGSFEKLSTPSSDGIVFGMWGPTAQDVWAVGRISSGAGLVLWHFDGTTWTAAAPPAGFPPGLLGFKVHGQRTDDVWFSCSAGMTLHWDGSAFEALATDATASLFSIVTTPNGNVTAGDVVPETGDGALDENAGSSGWTAAPLAAPVAWRGLAASTTGEVYVVGASGTIARRDTSGKWAPIQQTLIHQSFHADWVDPDGGLWAVGGQFDQTPTTSGFLLYYGTDQIPKLQ